MFLLIDMKTLTLEILDDRAINILKDLELRKLIRIQGNDGQTNTKPADLAAKYSGAMTQQSLADIDKQLSDLRNEWIEIPLGYKR
jgi:hypothetical protein